MFVLPDLRQIQFESVCNFFQKSLPYELESVGSVRIITKKRFEFKLFGKLYKLEKPQLTSIECIHNLSTYACNLYVPAHFMDTSNGTKCTETLWLGSIPLMDTNGTFVINGISRCIVNQILRTPGIYYTLNSDGIYIATIICNSGRRMRLELDLEGNVFVRITRKCKVSIVLLLFCMGLDIINIPSQLIVRTEKLDELVCNIDDAERRFHKTLTNLMVRQKIQNHKQESNSFWYDIFNIPYDLGRTGRLKVNQTLYKNTNITIPQDSILLPQDIVLIAEHLIKAVSSNLYVDDIDELSNKYIKSVGDIMYEQLQFALEDLKERISQRIQEISLSSGLVSPRRLIGVIPFTLTFNQFFGSYALSQFLDQTNPLADMVHKRRLSSLGPGGLSTRTATFRARDIHASQYGRICPVETAEGQNAGVVTSFTISAQINSEGIVTNPFYFVNNEFMQRAKLKTFASSEDDVLKIATGSVLKVVQNVDDKLTSPVQYRREFMSIAWNEVHLRNILPVHYFSIGVVLIPFLEHDDATRALMGSNMQRQAVPLINPQKSIVGTGLEAQVALDSGYIVSSMENGIIKYVDSHSILHLNLNGHISNIILNTFERSNNSTCIHQTPLVHTKEVIQQGQIMADGNATVNGELSLGQNILVAYMPWEGYNFEDAVLINERLVSEDIYTSLHIEEYEIELFDTTEGSEIITKDISHVNQYLLRNLDQDGIVLVGAWVEPGDVLVGKITPQESIDSHPESTLLQAIFGSEAVKTKDTSFKVPLRAGGRVIDVRWVSRDVGILKQNKMIRISILQKRKIKIGDKVAGRHGNKGIISKILSKQDMPYLQNGTPVDMVLSPLGVPSRMNVGQVLECVLGLAGGFLNKHYRIMPFDERYERGASRKLVFSELYESSKITNYPWLFEYDTPGKNRLFDGRSGEMFDQPITVGRAYMLKLIHQVDDKIHARSTGPYALVTQQPLRGKSRQGGQRVGEMEVWALQGFGAAYVLQEMLLIKSDHVMGRSDAFSAITSGQIIPKPSGAQDSLKLLIRELYCLGIKIEYSSISKRNLMRQQNDI